MGRSANELNAPFSFKSSASKSERGSALAERGTLGHFFAVAGSKKETFKEVAQKVAPVSEKSFGENGTAAGLGSLAKHGLRCVHVVRKDVFEGQSKHKNEPREDYEK